MIAHATFYVLLFLKHNYLFYSMEHENIRSTGQLYDYITARSLGEKDGECESAYPECPFSLFDMLGILDTLNEVN